ncbi:MAG: putative inorganic carbon transporter subunit DabA, partial [Nitrospirales bacterium]|nr:putative inorganic carbon transporter subunit DabA [Nitrospirales bacterium]
DVPATHRKDLLRLLNDLEEASRRNSHERLNRLPDESADTSVNHALARTKRRSLDWSQVRPEWGLSRHSAFVIGRRLLTQGINLEGRTFLHSYDYLQDPSGKYLEIIMTAPMIVGNWINMEHYFSTVDPWVYGSGSKVYHNVVGRVGVMYGSQSDLRVGLPVQTVFDGEKPYHEPMRLFVIIEAPLERINGIISRQDILQRLLGNQWINLVSLDPVSMEFFYYYSEDDWQLIR